MARRSVRTPFVITVAAAASTFSAGCGGETDGGSGAVGGTAGTTATGGTGGSTGGSGGSGATGGGGAGGTGALGGSGGTGGGGTGGTTGGVGGFGGNPPLCPAALPGWYEQCAPDGVQCGYDIGCQSGQVSITLTCTSGYWNVVPGTCAQPYDSCPGTDLYCSEGYGWTMPQGTNPPSPCPATKPAVGEKCYSGGFGGVHEKCGYPCDPATGAGWTVMTCPYQNGPDSAWESDGAC
jgi:hypothetical protein